MPKPKRNIDGIKRSTKKRTVTTKKTVSSSATKKAPIKKPAIKKKSKTEPTPVVEVETFEAEPVVQKPESMFDKLDSVVSKPKISVREKMSSRARRMTPPKSQLEFRSKKFWKYFITFLFSFALIFVAFSHFDRTHVAVSPTTVDVPIESLSAHRDPDSRQLAFDIISVPYSLQTDVQSTTVENVSEKASGTITIFNNYSSAPQRLVEETRFEAVDGKVYKLGKGEPIVIPGRSDGKPGSVDAIIYAAEPGPSYNSGRTDFTIPGFKEAGLTDKYEKIYALSKTDVRGGFVGNRPVVSDDDRRAAEIELKTRLESILMDSIKKQKTNRFILVDGSQSVQFDELEWNEPTGSKQSASLSARGFALLVGKEALLEYFKGHLQEHVPEAQANSDFEITNIEDLAMNLIQPNELPEDYSLIRKITVGSDQDMNLKWNIDMNTVKAQLAGVHRGAIVSTLGSIFEVAQAHVKIFPVWQSNISEEVTKIKVKISE